MGRSWRRVSLTRYVGALAAVLALGLGAQETLAQTKANKLFGAKSAPSKQNAQPLGTYAKGCLAGGEALPESGPTWQAMRLSRNRNYGHPEMIEYLKQLSAKVAQIDGWKGLYIGDISQPRGGPMLSSHQSHQVGLDADIWLLPPKRLNLTRTDREKISSLNIRARNLRNVNGNWTPQHMQVLKTAASDPRVDRIFVTAPAKIWMCNNARGNKKWLQKIRPIWGHNTHFHVRLKCPKGAVGCKKQTPTVAQLSKNATGCDSNLKAWVVVKKPDPNAPKPKPKPRKRGARDYFMADLPSQCRRVLTSR